MCLMTSVPRQLLRSTRSKLRTSFLEYVFSCLAYGWTHHTHISVGYIAKDSVTGIRRPRPGIQNARFRAQEVPGGRIVTLQ